MVGRLLGWFVGLLGVCLIGCLIRLAIRLFVRPCVGWLVVRLLGWSFGCLVDFSCPFVRSLVACLVVWFVGLGGWLTLCSFVLSFVDWLVGWLVDSSVRSFIGSWLFGRFVG